MAGSPKKRARREAAANAAEVGPSEKPALVPSIKYGAFTVEQVMTLRGLSLEDAIRFWEGFEKIGKQKGLPTYLGHVRSLCLADLAYLLCSACKRKDMLHHWLYERIREVEAAPDGYLDLWARGFYKSSIITFGLTIQDILKNPDETFGIFSHTRPIAKAFLRQIMRELESNELLHAAFPDVLWGKDTRASPKWSEDDGIIVRRKSNPKEATIEAWGLIDGQPTSKHYSKILYDDVVVKESVTTPEMIEKTMTSLEQSYNLGTEDCKKRMAGTRWHFNDAHRTVIDRGTFKRREHPARVGGTEDGDAVYMSEEVLQEKRRDMGPYTFAAQMLLNPKADNLQGFKREWLRFYKQVSRSDAMNKYILVDAASGKRKNNDYTSMWVVGLAMDGNYYALDFIRDRLNLTERSARLFALHKKWRPVRRHGVRYEKYGMMADIEHIKSQQEALTYHFDITEVGGQARKEDRIGRLIPIFEQGKFYLPETLYKTDYQKISRDLVHSFVEEEYCAFPVGIHDDMLDGLARIAEPDFPLDWPKEDAMHVRGESINQIGEMAWQA